MDTSDIPENIRQAFAHDSVRLRRISERIRRQRKRAQQDAAEEENRALNGGYFIPPTQTKDLEGETLPGGTQLKLPL